MSEARSHVRPPLLITGATGFIGARVLERLARAADREVRCLVRGGRSIDERGSIRTVHGDLDRPDSYASALVGTHTVLHLAARTGKASRSDHFAVNRDGTAALVRAARDAGVARFVNISTIATTYRRRPAYHYAESKAQGEAIVRSSGLTFVNLRPTIVLGRGSAVGVGLLKIATMPIVPLFGGGSVRVQPVHVDDVAECLVSVLDDARFDNRDLDVGGSEVLSMRELLSRLRAQARGRRGPFLSLPGLPIMQALAAVELVAGGLLPISAGQLSTFVNDSTASTSTAGSAMPRARCTLDEMIRDTVADV